MAKKILISIFSVYFLLGIIVSILYVKQNTQPNVAKIIKNIRLIDVQAQNQGDFFDKIPTLLNKNLHLAAIIVFSDSMAISGLFYEPKRISKVMVETFKPSNEIALRQVPIGNYHFTRTIQLDEIKRNATIFFKRKISFAELWNNLDVNGLQNIKPVIIIYVILGFVLLVLMVLSYMTKPTPVSKRNSLVFDKGPSAEDKQKSLEPPRLLTRKDSMTTPKEKISGIEQEVTNFSKEVENNRPKTNATRVLYQNQLGSILRRISTILPAKKITYFSWEDDKFIPVYQRFGEIFIRSQADEVPQILSKLQMPKDWDKIIRSADSKIIVIPVRKQNNLLGAFTLGFGENFVLNDKEINQALGKLEALSDEFAQSLFIQRTYERAVIDEETNFYTYPYFYFSLKERLMGNSIFAVLIFEIHNFDQNSPHTLLKWSREIKSLLPQKSARNDLPSIHTHNMSSHFISRLDRNRFAITFSMRENIPETIKGDGSLTINEVLAYCENIEGLSLNILANDARLFGTIVIKPQDAVEVESFRKRLEFALQTAKYHESFATVFDASLKATAS